MQTLASLNARYRNPHGVAMVYLLGWLAGCDGKIDEDENVFLQELGKKLLNDAGAVNVLLPLSQQATTSDIVSACRQLKGTVNPDRAHLVLELILAMAMVDGVFSVGENHIVRFLADALGIDRQQFVQSFQSVTGRMPQSPSDVSSASWWLERDRQRAEKFERERRDREQKEKQSKQRSSSPPPKDAPRRVEALEHLGLGLGATREEIKEAYKRLAKIHHPDRFDGLSVEIIEAANLSFRRIREAYEYLMQ